MDYLINGILDMLIQKDQIKQNYEKPKITRFQNVGYYANLPSTDLDVDLEEVVNNIPTIDISMSVRIMTLTRTVEGCGTGILLKDNYVLTAKHIVHMSDAQLMQETEGLEAKVLNTTGKVKLGNKEYSYQIVQENEDLDYAILKVDSDKSLGKGVTVGDSDKIKVGNVIYTIGNGAGQGLDVREGIVSKLEKRYPIGYKICTSADTTGGDSGGGVFAVRNNDLELIGLVQNKFRIFNYCCGVNRISEDVRTTNPSLYNTLFK